MIPVIKRGNLFARLPDGVVYIGRPSRWGNPYPVEQYGRDASIDLYRNHIRANPALVEALRARHPTALACWCAPLPCHGDVLAELLDK